MHVCVQVEGTFWTLASWQDGNEGQPFTLTVLEEGELATQYRFSQPCGASCSASCSILQCILQCILQAHPACSVCAWLQPAQSSSG